ncbi:MAG: c-type cytochrome [Elusimicrobia bacterium]|nr:c-type cytochrome [Elusimicrobiota bacterium]
MSRRSLLPAAILAVLVSVVILATRQDLTRFNPRIFTDLYRTPAVHSQESSTLFSDGRAMRPAPEGAVARGQEPLHYGPGLREMARAGRELKNPFPPTAENLARGRKVFESYCQHCHGYTGLGDGAVARAFKRFSFPVASPSVYAMPDGALFHVITFGHGLNLMPAHGALVSADDRWKVIDYLRTLQVRELVRLGNDPRRNEPATVDYGRELFAQNCASCHGEEGLTPTAGVPTLHLPPVISIAEDSYYMDIIANGRLIAGMPSWKTALTPSQRQSVLLYIRSWAWPTPRIVPYAVVKADPARGKALFLTHCIGCHGPEGAGGIGNMLNSPQFLSLASDDFLRRTISLGRHRTAMPAPYDLTEGDVNALIAYIRSWHAPAPAYDAVAALSAKASSSNGAKLFSAKCAACHGAKGEGLVGSSLSAPSFLAMADDRFLYNVITQGRPGTAMPAWRQLSAQEIADVISFIGTWRTSPAVQMTTALRRGNADHGAVLYQNNCRKCHGDLGAGDMGTQIGNPALLAQESDDFLWRTIAGGKTGTEMQGFLKRARDPLAPKDIDDLVAYLRRLQSHPPADGLKRNYSWASASDGKKVYVANCARCHGDQGEGGIGPGIGNTAFLQVASNGFLEGTVILGREGSMMPSFHDGLENGSAVPALSSDDIDNVVAYVRSFETHPPTAYREVDRSSDNASDGKALFLVNCARCHGADGRGNHGGKPGVYAPSLDPEFLKAVDDNFLEATIALGRPGTAMPTFGDGMNGKPGLAASDIQSIIAYLRSWEKHK